MHADAGRRGTALAAGFWRYSSSRERHGPVRQSRTRPRQQTLRRDARRRRDRPARARRRLLLPARPLGLRQDLHPADDRRPRDGQRRRHPDRRRQRHRPAAGQARHGDDVPELRAVPASQLRRQRRLLAEDARRRQGEAARAGDGVSRARRHGRPSPSACPPSSPAASSSASRWRAR